MTDSFLFFDKCLSLSNNFNYEHCLYFYLNQNRSTDDDETSKAILKSFEENIANNKEDILGSGVVVGPKEPFVAAIARSARETPTEKASALHNGVVDDAVDNGADDVIDVDPDETRLPALRYINLDGTQREPSKTSFTKFERM